MKKIIFNKFRQAYFFIKRIIDKINRFLNYYQIPRYSASISFYMLISIISTFMLAIQIFAMTTIKNDNFLIAKVIEIFSESFQTILIDLLPSLSLSGFSVIILLNFFWGASRTISGFDRIADFIYSKVKNRGGIWNRISAFLMFLMLLFVVLFLVAIAILGNYLIIDVFKVKYSFLIRFFQFIIELSLIFVTMLVLYLYAPPIKMKIKDALKGAAFASLLIYLLLGSFVIIITLMNKLGIIHSIITIFSLALSILYIANMIVIIGMIINYQKFKKTKL